MAQGTYTPDTNSADPNGSRSRYATFQLINSVSIKGGYAGFGEPDPNARDIELYETILSGDLDGNDVDVNNPSDLLNEQSRFENSYSVLTNTNANPILEGFLVTAGNANAGAIYMLGGGMYNSYGNPTVINCTFAGNHANRGGGICSFQGSPTIINCTFTDNYSSGGAMFLTLGAQSDIINCTLSKNRATDEGGGIYNRGFETMPVETIVVNSVLWNNNPDQISNNIYSSSNISYSDIQDGADALKKAVAYSRLGIENNHFFSQPFIFNRVMLKSI